MRWVTAEGVSMVGSAIRVGPYLVFGPVADRGNRRAIPIAHASGVLSVAQVYTVALLSATVFVFSHAAVFGATRSASSSRPQFSRRSARRSAPSTRHRRHQGGRLRATPARPSSSSAPTAPSPRCCLSASATRSPSASSSGHHHRRHVPAARLGRPHAGERQRHRADGGVGGQPFEAAAGATVTTVASVPVAYTAAGGLMLASAVVARLLLRSTTPPRS